MTVVQSIINMCVKKVSSFRCPTQHNWSAFLHKLLIFNNINLIQLYNFKLSILPHVFKMLSHSFIIQNVHIIDV